MPQTKEQISEYHQKYYQRNKARTLKRMKKNKEKRSKENRAWRNEYLSHHPCVDCGFSDIRALDFDHVCPPSEKKCNVSLMWTSGYKLSTIQEEVAKCEVRCANCHRIKTAKDQQWKKHNTPRTTDGKPSA